MAFTWPRKPKTEAEFEALMQAIDGALAEKKLEPWKRPVHIGRLLWEAFSWGGKVFPPRELADQKGFDGDILMAKAQKWYEEIYGDNLKTSWALGFAPIKIGRSVWRVRMGEFAGKVLFFIDRNLNNRGRKLSTKHDTEDASCNILCEIEGFTQGLADRLNEAEISTILSFYSLLIDCMTWRKTLPRTELFKISCADYDESTSSLLAGNYEQSMWASQQSVEKLIKGILESADKKYEKGRKGHDLRELGKTLEAELNIKTNQTLLDLANCSPNIRYGTEDWTESKALQANHAALGIIKNIIDSKIKIQQKKN
ncbi:HEPN domain-containing protein [Pseudomonas sp. BN414]|uniref:HEPN domain-containing protein n=1 Tax=Pseudomonas sp. BN414 TaxID=2567888 RepID=UPI002453F926|nr:HEPN domain-containing protein [Pseudomonas sp. BN414]MDH4568845.1 HEPN domain-containing protein [Pseudomonas sp. BN414]